MKPSVTIISIFCPPEVGAAPFRILNTAKVFKSFGWKVNIITALANYPTGKIFSSYRKRLFKLENVEGIDCLRLWLFPSNSNNPFIRLFSMFSFSFSLLFTLPLLIVKRPDFLFVQTPPILVGFTSVIIAKLLSIKVVLNVADIWPLTASELGVIKEDGYVFKLFSQIEKFMYKYSYAFIGQSQQTCDYLSERVNKPVFLYRNLSTSIHNSNNFKSSNKFRIVYAGLLGLAQGVSNICEKIDFKLLNAEFHIYGNGIERDRIQSYINSNKNCNVFLHKTVSKQEIQKILLSFDATIISLKSRIFGAFPSKISMAISSNLPIFYSGFGEGAEIIEKYKIGFVSEPENLKKLQSNIQIYIDSDLSFKNKIKNNLSIVDSTHFNYEKQQEKLNVFLTKNLFN